MTREEAIEWLNKLYIGADITDEYGDMEDMQPYGEAVNMAIEALEQEPCEDCISRQAVIEVLNKMDRYVADELTLCDTERKFPKNEVFIVDDVYEEIVEQLPFVTHKTGHWIKIKPYPLQMHDYECSECGHETDDNTENYCSECGAKMFEPQESEG